jgi:hypothetical protein
MGSASRPRAIDPLRAPSREVLAMELHDLIRHEWRDDHVLSRRSLIWIDEHADPGDLNPIATAIAQLRAERVDRL